MLLLDGIEYEVKTPEENTDDLVTFVNEYCESNDVKNSYGETVYVENNDANPLYMLLYGMGYMTTVLQKLVYNAGCSLSIAEASERQLLNIADIAGIKRTTATKTIIQGTVYANEDDVYAVPCKITTKDTATLIIAGNEIVFQPAFDVTVPIGGAAQIVLVAQEYGAYNISAGTITQFDEPIEGFRRLITTDSTPGQNEESIATLRARLQRRTVEGSQIDRAASAIQDLEGVAMCNIYFNYSPALPETVMIGETEVSVPPRKALLLVQGYNDNIAKVFYRYLFCETVNPGNVEGVIPQQYVTRAGQSLPVYIIPPANQPIYVRIYINNVLSYEQTSGIRDMICSLAGTLIIGSTVTSVDVINVVSASYSNLIIQGCELSLDGVNYDYKVTVGVASIPTFNVENIEVTGI